MCADNISVSLWQLQALWTTPSPQHPASLFDSLYCHCVPVSACHKRAGGFYVPVLPNQSSLLFSLYYCGSLWAGAVCSVCWNAGSAEGGERRKLEMLVRSLWRMRVCEEKERRKKRERRETTLPVKSFCPHCDFACYAQWSMANKNFTMSLQSVYLH